LSQEDQGVKRKTGGRRVKARSPGDTKNTRRDKNRPSPRTEQSRTVRGLKTARGERIGATDRDGGTRLAVTKGETRKTWHNTTHPPKRKERHGKKDNADFSNKRMGGFGKRMGVRQSKKKK